MYQNIYPNPKKVTCADGSFTFLTELAVKINPEFTMRESLDLFSEIWNNFTAGVCRLKFEKTNDVKRFEWQIGTPQDVALSNGMSYCVHTDKDGISIKADNDRSLVYGFYTLLQIVKPLCLKDGEEKFAVNCGTIEDAPDIAFRCMHFSIKLPISILKLRMYFRFAALMKFTHFVVEFYGSVRFDCLPELSWPGALGKEELKPIFDEARLMGVEFIPLFNSLGHAGMGTLMDQKNVILDQNPRYELLFEPNGWSFCISNPETIDLINKASDELIDLMGPGEYFHIGIDESLDFATCDLCSTHNKGEFLADFVNSLAKRMKAKGRRTMFWADMLLSRDMFDPELTYKKGGNFPVANACDKLPTHEALGKIDKDVIIVDWQYFTADKNNPTSKYIADNGYDVVTASYNNFANMQLLAESAAVNNYFGYMSTEWGEEKLDADLMLYSADVAWNGKNASEIDSFRLEERFHVAGKLRRKLLTPSGTMEDAGWY